MSRYRTIFRSALSPYTGYGADGLTLTSALLDASHDVYLSPLSVQAPLPVEVAACLTRALEPPYDVYVHHADPESSGLPHMEARSARKRLFWTMWEFRSFPPDWLSTPEILDPLRQKFAQYDTILAYDAITKQALEPVLQDDHEVHILQGGYRADLWSDFDPRDRDWSGTFRFLMDGQLHHRKNPWASIYAFDLLKQRHGDAFDATLTLRTNVRVFHPSMQERYPWLHVVYETLSLTDLKELYYASHVFLAPSWGEGKNLPAIQSQTTGMACIATNFGGHSQWMPFAGTFEVEFTEESHLGEMYSARASVEDLADKMWMLYNDRGLARQQGELAARTLPSVMDWSVVLRRLEDIAY